MTSQHPPHGSSGLPQHRTNGFLSREFVDLALPPLRFGMYTGSAGVFAGIAGAIARDTNPTSQGLLTGVQWFTLGGTFWYSRSVVLQERNPPEALRSSDKVIASGIAGTTTGAVSGLLRGAPTKIIPAMILWGLVGAGGQMLVNGYESLKLEPKRDDGGGFWSSLSPMQKLTDEEYMDILREKKLKIDVDISLIDDRIAELRALELKGQEADKSATGRQN